MRRYDPTSRRKEKAVASQVSDAKVHLAISQATRCPAVLSVVSRAILPKNVQIKELAKEVRKVAVNHLHNF